MWAITAGISRTLSGGVGSSFNLVPYGAMLTAANPGTANANNYRPLQGYGNVVQATNNLYANYNALQVSWARHAGRYTIQTNYTWQKAMGIVNPTNDPFSLSANYGPQASDRRNLFNVAYSIDLGTVVHSNALVDGVAQRVAALGNRSGGERRQPHLWRQYQKPDTESQLQHVPYLRSDRGRDGCWYLVPAIGCDHPRLYQHGEPNGYRHQQSVHPGNQ